MTGRKVRDRRADAPDCSPKRGEDTITSCLYDLAAGTASQVQSRRNDTVADLADEWDREAPTFEEGLRVLGYKIGSHYVADLL